MAAETLSVLASATRAIARAAGSAGRSTGGPGSGSKPTKTSGSPVSSSQPPSPTAISVGGGRIAVIVRTAVEPPAVSARRGTGPSARRLPASHTMSRAWTAPKPAPIVRSAAPSSPLPSFRVAALPTPAPSDSPMATAPIRPISTTNGRKTGSISPSGSAEERQCDRTAAPPIDGPDESGDLRDRARAPAEDDRDDHEQERDGVDGVHRPIVAQAGRRRPRTGRVSRAGRPRAAVAARIGGQATVTVIGAAPPVVSLIV